MLRAAQVCVILDVAPNTLAAWRRQGRPPSGVPLNGRHYYDLQALAAFMSGES
jgi:predicted site-specific integrase-resolvase